MPLAPEDIESVTALTARDLHAIVLGLSRDIARSIKAARQALAASPPNDVAAIEEHVTYWLSRADESLAPLSKLRPTIARDLQAQSAAVLLALDDLRCKEQAAKVG